MFRLVMVAALASVAVVGVAQDDANTTASTRSPNAVRTTSTLGNRGLAAEHFEKRWEREEQIYKEVGVSEEKIAKLKEINQKIWNARAGGEKVDFRDLSRQRSELLTEDEMKRYRDVLNSRIPQQLRSRDGRSTAPATAQTDKVSTATAE